MPNAYFRSKPVANSRAREQSLRIAIPRVDGDHFPGPSWCFDERTHEARMGRDNHETASGNEDPIHLTKERLYVIEVAQCQHRHNPCDERIWKRHPSDISLNHHRPPLDCQSQLARGDIQADNRPPERRERLKVYTGPTTRVDTDACPNPHMSKHMGWHVRVRRLLQISVVPVGPTVVSGMTGVAVRNVWAAHFSYPLRSDVRATLHTLNCKHDEPRP